MASPWQNASDQSAHSFLPPKVDTSNCRWGWGLPAPSRPSEEAANSQNSRKGYFQLANWASEDNSRWNLGGEFHQMHEDATVQSQRRQADSKMHGNLNLKPHQLSVRLPLPPHLKRSIVVKWGLLSCSPLLTQGKRVCSLGKLPNRAEWGKGKERKGEGGCRLPCLELVLSAQPSDAGAATLAASRSAASLDVLSQAMWNHNLVLASSRQSSSKSS